MKKQSYLTMVLVVLGVLALLAVQGCLFGGRGGEEEGGTEPAETGAEPGAPPEAEAGAEAPGEAMPPGAETGPEAGEAGAPMPPGFGPEETAPAPPAGDAASLVAAAMKAKHGGDIPTAQRHYEAAVAADPNNVDAHWGLAWIYSQKGMKEKAITEFNKVKSLGASADKVAEADAAIARLSK
jgi:hypothetical protein